MVTIRQSGRRLIMLVAMFFVAGFTSALLADDAPVRVRVGGYQFEPFVEGEKGVSIAFVKFLNARQNRYVFEFVEIPARRRYELLADGKIDMVFFEMPLWGWTDIAGKVETTTPLVRGSDVMVSREDHPLGSQVFDELQKRKIAVTFGYHYGFSGFSADPDHIRTKFNVIFAKTQRHALKHVLTGNADIAIVSDAFLDNETREQPALAATLRIADRVDQRYELPLLVRRMGPIGAGALNQILTEVIADGSFGRFLADEGLSGFSVVNE